MQKPFFFFFFILELNVWRRCWWGEQLQKIKEKKIEKSFCKQNLVYFHSIVVHAYAYSSHFFWTLLWQSPAQLLEKYYSGYDEAKLVKQFGFFFEAKCLDRWLHICLTSGWMNKNLNNEYKDFLTFLFRFKFFYFFGRNKMFHYKEISLFVNNQKGLSCRF